MSVAYEVSTCEVLHHGSPANFAWKVTFGLGGAKTVHTTGQLSGGEERTGLKRVDNNADRSDQESDSTRSPLR